MRAGRVSSACLSLKVSFLAGPSDLGRAFRADDGVGPGGIDIGCFGVALYLRTPRQRKAQIVQVQVIALGDQTAWVSLPGEIFVELGLAIKKGSPFPITCLAELANGSIGYICTAQAHKEGGYEPNNSQSGPGAEEILIAESLRLADRVVGDVFESFAPPTAPARKDRK